MARGRKAEPGTYEAREKIGIIADAIQKMPEVSQDAKKRSIKALYFGLNVKMDAGLDTVQLSSDNAIAEQILKNEEDEYFKPDQCYEMPEQE